LDTKEKTAQELSVSIASSSRIKLGVEDVTKDMEGIQKLMKNGSWRAVLKLVDKCMKKINYPHEKFQLKLCKILALIKTRSIKSASDELDSIGDFESKENSYEKYANLYPKLRGSMVPFSLRVIKAELPYYLKAAVSLDPLYELLSLCRKEISHFSTNEKREKTILFKNIDLADSLSPLPAPSTSFLFSILDSEEVFSRTYEETLSIWIEREIRIIYIIATHLIQEKEFPSAILLLQEILQKNPNDPVLLSSLGRINLQYGNVKSASAFFKQVESLISEKEPLFYMNRGYLALSMDQYTVAIDNFQLALDLDPNNIAACNNKAISLLYTCELGKAITVLEELIKKDPEKNLNETVVFNLCTLYDLKSDSSTEKKRNLMNLVAKFGSDSFDLSVLKLNS